VASDGTLKFGADLTPHVLSLTMDRGKSATPLVLFLLLRTSFLVALLSQLAAQSAAELPQRRLAPASFHGSREVTRERA